MAKTKPARIHKHKLALLIACHNEEMVLETTIKSAVASGQKIEDIFVVDDNSSDKTREIAVRVLGVLNVLTVPRSGKAGAVYQAIKVFGFEERYQWVHISDGDSIFGEDYFRNYRRGLTGKEYVVAVGFIQSLRGNWIANYRSLSYTYSQHVMRRFQSWFNMISVLPGPITSFRTDIIQYLDFRTGVIAEDFDVTLQIYRMGLGKVRYIPDAICYTQDPQNLRDFCKQTFRWQRGFWQGVTRHRIGTKLQSIDISIGYQVFQMVLWLFEFGFLVPYTMFETGKWIILPILMVLDFTVVSILTIFSAIVAKRYWVLAALPYYYFLRYVELGIFLWAFVEIVILRRYHSTLQKGWVTEGRRYAIDKAALREAHG